MRFKRLMPKPSESPRSFVSMTKLLGGYHLFDLNYAGVILGPSVKYRNGKVIFDPSESCNEKAIRNRTLSDGTKQKFGEILIQHEVRVLMTRGVNGMYIYACDPELQKALLEAAK